MAAQVQGESAPASLVGAFRKVERYAASRIAAGRPDEAPAVTILARGGGSLEDLWAFNDEAVVRAVVAHSIPVVCGVGHEVDVTLADFAADVRAPTPSAAAEVVVPDRADFLASVRSGGRRLDGAVAARLRTASREVSGERRALERLSPVAQLASARERVGLLLDRATRAVVAQVAEGRRTGDRLAGRLVPTLPARLARDRGRVERASVLTPLANCRVTGARASLGTASAALAVLGPQATLDRGYAIVRRAGDGRIVRDPGTRRAAPGWRCASPAVSCRPRRTSPDRERPATPMNVLVALVVFVLLVTAVVVVGLRLGMLLAPRIDRLTAPHDEAEGGDDDRPDD